MAAITIEVETETLEEARAQLKSQVPKGLHLLSEKILSNGKPTPLKAVADTSESAFTKAKSEVPGGADILDQREISAPAYRLVSVQAFDEQGAQSEVKRRLEETEVVKSLKVTFKGRKGFLGIGKTPNEYEVHVLKQAVVEIVYKAKPKISVSIGEIKHRLCVNFNRPVELKEVEDSFLCSIGMEIFCPHKKCRYSMAGSLNSLMFGSLFTRAFIDYTVDMDVVSDLSKVLSNPGRREMLRFLLKHNGCTFEDIDDNPKFASIPININLRKLEEAGLIITRQEFHQKSYFLNPDWAEFIQRKLSE